MASSIGKRLEQYTLKRPQEVLIVTAKIGEITDKVVIFKGFSSSLIQPTAFDPDTPVLAEDATITQIDRVASPYSPANPAYIEQGLTQAQMEQLLITVGV